MGGSGEAQASPPAAERIDFTLERGRHRRFVGREDVLARLDAWLLGPDDTGWVVVTGGPGMGKSALLSKWLDRREAASAAVPHHLVRRQVIDWDQPERIAASLAAQIEAMFPEQRDARAKPEGRFPELLGRVSKRLGASGRLVIVVDGLDETRAEPSENPLPRFLPQVVPAGIRILCATRPTYPHLGWIEARTPARRVNLDDDQWASSNEAVVRGFREAVGPDDQPPLPAATVAAAIARAEGNVLHAVMLHDVLRDLPPVQRRAECIPGGFRHLIGEVWDRAASTQSVRVGLGVLCAAQEALSLDALAEVAAWSYDDKEWFVREARQLLLEEPASWAGAAAYRPRHDWVRELMAERLGGAALRAHHETLARTLARRPSAADPTARRYALRHALIHCVEAGAWADAWRLAADMSFLEAKCRELGAHEAEADVEHVAERCRASGDEALRERFGDLARALARESHWLRAAPEATAALMWNRLRQLGWSVDELDQQLQLPVGSKFLRVRHVATRESPALVRDLVGHARGVTACAVTPDGRRVVSASVDQTLKVWDLATGRTEATLEGHAKRVTAGAVTPDGPRVVSASHDHTLKVWDLATGRAEATLEGHAGGVTVCAVTPDGRRAVSASEDNTLKVWDLQEGACLLTHRANATCLAVATTATAIIAGDAAGAVWFLDWPSPDARHGSSPDDRRPDNQPTPPSDPAPPAQRPPMKHTILFLAANPLGTDRIALDLEARAIQVELERSGFRDRFELVTRWAAEPLDLLRELRKLKPTVVHFSGHGTAGIAGHAHGPTPRRDVDIEPDHNGGDSRPGLFFQGPDGGPQLVSTEALEATFGAAGSSVQLIVLNACYSELHARALLRHVGCVVGMDGAITDDAARSFAIGFYGGLGERESIAAAYAQGCAAISLQGLADHDRPRLAVRAGIDAGKLVLAGAMESPHATSRTDQIQPRREPYVAPPQTRKTRMAADDLFNLLSKLLPAQFEAVLFRARVPIEYLPAATAPQAERAIATIRYFELQGRLSQLARAVQQVVTGGGVGTDRR